MVLACGVVTVAMLLSGVSSARAEFGIEPGSLKTTFENAEGVSRMPQASSHPYAFTISFKLNTDSEGHSEGGELRDVLIDLPPGHDRQPDGGTALHPPGIRGLPRRTATPIPRSASLTREHSRVRRTVSGPIYNMVPPPGSGGAARVQRRRPQRVCRTPRCVSGSEGYGLLVATNGLPLEVTAVDATIWGDPRGRRPRRASAAQISGGRPRRRVVGAPTTPSSRFPRTAASRSQTTVSKWTRQLNPGISSRRLRNRSTAGGRAGGVDGL